MHAVIYVSVGSQQEVKKLLFGAIFCHRTVPGWLRCLSERRSIKIQKNIKRKKTAILINYNECISEGDVLFFFHSLGLVLVRCSLSWTWKLVSVLFFSDRFHKHHLRRSVSLKTLTVLLCVVAVHPGPCVFLMLRIRIEWVFYLFVFFFFYFLNSNCRSRRIRCAGGQVDDIYVFGGWGQEDGGAKKQPVDFPSFWSASKSLFQSAELNSSFPLIFIMSYAHFSTLPGEHEPGSLCKHSLLLIRFKLS